MTDSFVHWNHWATFFCLLDVQILKQMRFSLICSLLAIWFLCCFASEFNFIYVFVADMLFYSNCKIGPRGYEPFSGFKSLTWKIFSMKLCAKRKRISNESERSTFAKFSDYFDLQCLSRFLFKHHHFHLLI